MSYILDALKKLEHEKSRKSRKDGLVNISGALFENERPLSSGVAGWKIALAVLVAVLVTFGATWRFFRSGTGGRSQIPPLAQPVPAPRGMVKAVPAAPVLPPVVPAQQAPLTVPPVPVQETPLKLSAPLPKPRTTVVQAAPVADDNATQIPPRELRLRKKDRKEQVRPADQTIAAPADIQLSGIAWQEDHRARRAVVNGFLMQEGGIVSGARITDIYQDRVRFSLSGRSFEIPLISSAVSAAGK